MTSPPDDVRQSGSTPAALVDKLQSYCNVVRDDGISTIEDVEQLTQRRILQDLGKHERQRHRCCRREAIAGLTQV